MRNLKLYNASVVKCTTEAQSYRYILVDIDRKILYLAGLYGIVCFDTAKNEVEESLDMKATGYLSNEDYIVNIQQLISDQAIILATSRGRIYLWQHQEVEEVACIGDGIKTMALSPDEDILVFVTGNHTLILMTNDFEHISEAPIVFEESAADKFISIGWGKKETQFQGSVGKEAALSKAEVAQPAPPTDDGGTRISWCGDGQSFVVSCINIVNGSRQLTVWSRNGTHEFTSEVINGLEHPLSWRPTGNLIASTRRRADGYHVVFLEKNGLMHGGFTLPVNEDYLVRELSWNNDSTILAVWCDRTHTENKPNCTPVSYMFLYTTSNYHWYLKQTHSSADDAFTAFSWHTEYPCVMYILCQSGKLIEYVWSWTTNRSLGLQSRDVANVFVIDGCDVLVTPFRLVTIPPPFCAYKLTCPSFINQVCCGPPTSCNNSAVLTTDGRLFIFGFGSDEHPACDGVSVEADAAGGNGFKPTVQLPHLTHHMRLPLDNLGCVSHLTWLDEVTFLLIGCPIDQYNSVLYVLKMSQSDEGWDLIVSNKLAVPGRVYSSCVYNGFILQLTDGQLYHYSLGSDVIGTWPNVGSPLRLPQICSSLAVTRMGNQVVLLGLTDHYRFFINDQEVASNCTSFVVRDDFICLTTLSHTCRCIAKDSPLASDGLNDMDESSRNVERGSRIVTAVTGDTKLVLQMPRGNLETIHPRALVLTLIKSYLNQLQFGVTFSIMKKHRINLNLLHDHDPKVFIDNVHIFIEQLGDVANLNLFLSELTDKDVTMTMYNAVYKNQNSMADNPGKVDRVCECVRQALTSLGEERYLLSIVTSHVKKTEPELETVLNLVKQRPESSDMNRSVVLGYVLFLVDVNKLYDIALGMYDLDLVLMVAERSQKDPKEYIPFLNQLKQMDQHYRHFTIDNKLKRYGKALASLIKCDGRFDECIQFIKQRALYSYALQLLKPSTTEYKTISSFYAVYLRDESRTDEAGIMFMKAQDYGSALECFEKSMNWQQALSMSYRLQQSSQQRTQLCLRLIETLKRANKFFDAAVIHEKYLKDIEEAVATLVEGSHWLDASLLIHTHDRLDLVDSHLQPQIIESCRSHYETLQTMKGTFTKHMDRLAVVRRQNERTSELYDHEDKAHPGMHSDLFSDTASAMGDSVVSSITSTGSQSSRASGKSSRNRRKAERKKWSLKEGSPHEDLALMEALQQIIVYFRTARDEIGPLLHILACHNLDDQARILQKEMEECMVISEGSIENIWPKTSVNDLIIRASATSASLAFSRQSANTIPSYAGSPTSQAPLPPPTITPIQWTLTCLKDNLHITK